MSLSLEILFYNNPINKNIMRKIFLYFSLLLFMQTAFAADSLFVRKPQIPILIDRTDNILVEMRVQAHKGDVLNKLSLQFKEGIDLNDIKALRFSIAERKRPPGRESITVRFPTFPVTQKARQRLLIPPTPSSRAK